MKSKKSLIAVSLCLLLLLSNCSFKKSCKEKIILEIYDRFQVIIDSSFDLIYNRTRQHREFLIDKRYQMSIFDCRDQQINYSFKHEKNDNFLRRTTELTEKIMSDEKIKSERVKIGYQGKDVNKSYFGDIFRGYQNEYEWFFVQAQYYENEFISDTVVKSYDIDIKTDNNQSAVTYYDLFMYHPLDTTLLYVLTDQSNLPDTLG